MSNYHFGRNGEPSPCNAQEGNCPLGNVEHFSSKEEAQSAYESKMQKEVKPLSKNKGSLKLSELNKLAKDSDDEAILNEAVDRGSNRTHKNLLKNPNLTSDQAIRIKENTEDSETRTGALRHPSFPVSEMTPEEFTNVGRHQRGAFGSEARVLASDDVTDEKLNAYVEGMQDRFGNPPGVNAALANENNKISQESIVKHGSRNYFNLNTVLKNKRFPVSEMKNLPKESVYWGNIDQETDPEYLHGYGEWVQGEGRDKDQYLAGRIANNPNTPTKTLDEFAKKGLAPVEVYANSNTSETSRKHLKENYPEVARKSRIMDLDRQTGGIKKEITLDSKGSTPYSGAPYHSVHVKLDKEKIKEYNLSREEVLDIMGYKGYNAGSSYNEETGEFYGSIDSSG